MYFDECNYAEYSDSCEIENNDMKEDGQDETGI
jgi:hypothetical protein